MPSGTVVISIESPTDGMSFGVGTLVPIPGARPGRGRQRLHRHGQRRRVHHPRRAAPPWPRPASWPGLRRFRHTGRVSLAADLLTGTYTLWVTAKTSGGGTGKQSVTFTVDSGPSITITAPVKGGSYRTGLVVVGEGQRLDPANPPTATGRSPQRRADGGGRSRDHLQRSGHVRLRSEPAAARRAPAPDRDRHQRRRKARGGAAHLHRRQHGAGDHGHDARARADGRRHHEHLGAGSRQRRGPGRVGRRHHRRRDGNTAVRAAAQAARRRQLRRPVRHRPPHRLQATAVAGPLHRVPDHFVPRLGPGRQRDGPRLRLLRRQHPPGGRPRPTRRARHEARRRAALLARLQPAGRRHLRRRHAERREGRAPGLRPARPHRGRRQPRRRPQAPAHLAGRSGRHPASTSWTTPASRWWSTPTATAPATPSTRCSSPPRSHRPRTTRCSRCGSPRCPSRARPTSPPTRVPANAPCISGLDPEPPEPLCGWDQPTIAITYAFGQPAIWSVEPVNQVRCHGNQFDALANHISEQWACIAVGTRDHAGNYSVSAPLRVYIDYDFRNGATAYAFGASPPSGAGAPPGCRGTFANGRGDRRHLHDPQLSVGLSIATAAIATSLTPDG